MMRMRPFFQHSSSSLCRNIRTTTRNSKTYLCLAVAAALSTSTQAWVATAPGGVTALSTLYPIANSGFYHPSQISQARRATIRSTATTRLYFSSPSRDNNNNDNKDDTVGGIVGMVKSMLPTKWFGTQKEKEALQRRAEVKDQVSGELNEMLKGAPLGIRMIGKMVAPLMGSLASALAEGVAEQQRTTEGLLDDARIYILNDRAVADALGAPVQMGQPFSQSSSMTSVNGKMQSRVEMSMNIAGTKRNGVARLLATEAGISQLIVESGGKVFNVNISNKQPRSTASMRGAGGSSNDENIIEAEIIDKETKR
jgi:hypothetical protein